MTTSTRRTHVERFAVHQGVDDDKRSTYFESDSDLAIRLSRGGIFEQSSLTDAAGMVVVALDVDGEPYAVVKVDSRTADQRDRDILDRAIEHLEDLRDALQNLERAGDSVARERNAFELGRDAQAQGLPATNGVPR